MLSENRPFAGYQIGKKALVDIFKGIGEFTAVRLRVIR
jgi:hypothetical protein